MDSRAFPATRPKAKAARPAMEPKTQTTMMGEPILKGLPICVPKILMPREGIDFAKWACVACDQYESEPAYWEEMNKHVGESPSALRIVFPEVYLALVTGADPSEDDKRIKEIGEVMNEYSAGDVFASRPPAFMAIDRKTSQVASRKGLIVAVDLDQYNYDCPIPTLIRPTEKTIVARLPPRIKIRETAPLELPHIIMVIDDPGKTVIEPLFKECGLSEPEYSCDLFKGAGKVSGFRVTPQGTEHFTRTMTALADKEKARAAAANRHPAVILIGDGNHSLATAKSCWESLKAKGADAERHPARYALVELQNLHDDGVVFEPIHRILEDAKADAVQHFLEKAWGVTAQPFQEPVPEHAVVLVRGKDKSSSLILVPPAEKLPVVAMSAQVDQFVAENPNTKIGYVHGEEPVYDACKDGTTTGLLLPSLDKSRFLDTIHDIGTFPRKAFSMGEASEKRFYVEARAILPDVCEPPARKLKLMGA